MTSDCEYGSCSFVAGIISPVRTCDSQAGGCAGNEVATGLTTLEPYCLAPVACWTDEDCTLPHRCVLLTELGSSAPELTPTGYCGRPRLVIFFVIRIGLIACLMVECGVRSFVDLDIGGCLFVRRDIAVSIHFDLRRWNLVGLAVERFVELLLGERLLVNDDVAAGVRLPTPRLRSRDAPRGSSGGRARGGALASRNAF